MHRFSEPLRSSRVAVRRRPAHPSEPGTLARSLTITGNFSSVRSSLSVERTAPVADQRGLQGVSRGCAAQRVGFSRRLATEPRSTMRSVIVHAGAMRRGDGFLFFLGNFRDQGLCRQHQRGDGRRVRQRRSHDLRRIDDAGFDEILVSSLCALKPQCLSLDSLIFATTIEPSSPAF